MEQKSQFTDVITDGEPRLRHFGSQTPRAFLTRSIILTFER